MIVQKFGGTSVGSAGPIARLAEIVRAHRDRSPVVVVSAVGGVTNKLFALANQALAGSDTRAEFAALAAQHQTILKELGLPEATIARELGELERVPIKLDPITGPVNIYCLHNSTSIK